MRMLRHLAAVALVVGIGSSSAFAQQRHLVDSAALAASVRDHAATQASDRAAIHATLARPEVQQAAKAAGIDMNQVSAAVNTMSATELARTAAAAHDVDGSLVGGASTIVISTTTIIIALLVLILLIVAID